MREERREVRREGEKERRKRGEERRKKRRKEDRAEQTGEWREKDRVPAQQEHARSARTGGGKSTSTLVNPNLKTLHLKP